ncbi:carbohydrate ABC transporter permease [Brevibacterium aurantiacum]|uniref:Carbohydrate ABC transporter permease n=1 Tax=Brevibacterium aurantiacum TaxID=273384 RepID=A0A556CAT2_BREAU|nr:carbohydrate ABC transporter permease [Brevibacterium aurantiacum]TSI14555.1 carbohydrate ABC transporter permease [Brevibacterium aurantiacum]
MSQYPSSRITRLIVRYALLLILVVIAGFPIYWMLNTALADPETLYTKDGQSSWLQLDRLPEFFNSLSTVPVFMWLRNSTFIAAGTTVLSLLLGILAGYALSRFRFRGKGVVSTLMYTTQVIPEALILVPLYGLFVSLGLINSLWGLVIANAGFALPVAAFIVKSAVDSVPYEIEEAAMVDNTPRFTVLTMIVCPLILPSLAAAAVITFFAAWNEYLFAATFLLDSGQWPASVGLASFIGQYDTPLPAVMGAAVVFSIPAIVFFLLVQRKIVSGLTAGAVKG